MSLQNLSKYVTTGVLILTLLYCAFLIGQWKGNNQGTILTPSQAVATAPTHTFRAKVPQQGIDKSTLQAEGYISKETAKDERKEITAAAEIKDGSGTRKITSQEDTDTGKTIIVQQRPLSEFLTSNALGIGAGFRPEGFFKEVYYRRDLSRLWDFYVSADAHLYFLDAGRHDWQVGVKGEYRF